MVLHPFDGKGYKVVIAVQRKTCEEFGRDIVVPRAGIEPARP